MNSTRISLFPILLLVSHGLVAQEPEFPDAVFVLPFTSAPGVNGVEPFAGVGLENLLEHMLLVDGTLPETRAETQYRALFPEFEDLTRYVGGRSSGPEKTAGVRARWLMSGKMLSANSVAVRIDDRRTENSETRQITLDFPSLVKFRRGVLTALEASGVPISRSQRRAMLWRESLSVESLALAGRRYLLGIYGSKDDADLAQAAQLAPRSYLALDALANARWKRQEYGPAEELFQQALKHNPNGVDAWEGLILIAGHDDRIGRALAASAAKAKIRGEPANAAGVVVELSAAFRKNQHFETADAVLEPGVARAATVEDQRRIAVELQELGAVYEAKAIRLFEQALSIERWIGDHGAEAGVFSLEGWAYQKAKQKDDALRCYQQELQIRRELRDPAGEAKALAHIAFVYMQTSEYDKAIDWYKQELALQTKGSDRGGTASALEDLAFAFWMAHQYAPAIAYYQQALPIQRELKDRDSEATTLDRMAFAYRRLKQVPESVRSSEQALAIHREQKDRKAEASTLDDLSLGYYLADDFRDAVPWLEQELPVQQALNDRPAEARTLNRLGYSYYRLNQNDAAFRAYQRSLDLLREINDRTQEAGTLRDLGFAYYMSRHYEEAASAYQQELALRRELSDRAAEALALGWLGNSYDHMNQFPKAQESYEKALAIQRDLKDQAAEASILGDMADLYSHTHEYEKSANYYQQALAIERARQDRSGEASTLFWLGSLYDDQQEQAKAISYYEQELAIRRELRDRLGEAKALSHLGSSERGRSDYQAAMSYYEQALAIEREVKDRDSEGRTLNQLGMIQALLGRYDKELENFEQALAVAREQANPTNQGLALVTLGMIYAQLGRFDKAIEALDQVLPIARAQNYSTLETGALMTLGVVYSAAGQRDKGSAYLDQALAASRRTGDRQTEGRIMVQQAKTLFVANHNDQAIAKLEAGLAIARETKDRVYEGIALNSLGAEYVTTGRFELATPYLTQALAIARERKMREFEAGVLSNMMVMWVSRKQPRLAIALGKESVNILQELRTSTQSLDPALQQSFIQARKSTYRYLANILAGQGRLAEAQQILDLQKLDEFTSFVQRDRSVAAGENRATLTAQETEWQKRYREVADQLTSLGVRRDALLAKPNRSAPDEQELTAIDSDLEAGNQAFEAFLDSLEKAPAASAAKQVSELKDAQGLMETLHDLGKGVVAVYTSMGEDGFRSILITPAVQKGYFTPVAAVDLNKKILAFREAVRDPGADPRPLAKELYDILVKPLEKDLAGAQAQTIMWSLDGALRYLPIAALYDGQKYLLERFRNVVFTPASQSRLKDPVTRDWRGLGLGVSLPHGDFQALPNVPGELHAIIRDNDSSSRGVLPGVVKLDGGFTKADLEIQLRQQFTVVHLASHFDFAPGTDRNSFLLLGDGNKLTLEDFRRMPQVLRGVELLTLSACDTAVGGEDADGREVEGFAVLAQRQGAKAVVATLWEVADNSTALLMREFYRRRMSDPAITKAEALRQAQLALLSGAVGGSKSPERGVAVNHGSGTPVFEASPQRPYAHPYFWAPFILMGNWK
ncbi:MAG TPA: tetratricopeptide repeat protein [Bryobacteraceae bacterium]|nr:tetratricopeptide repeat protein [Bryobacteraceae bacterium]